MRSFLLFLLVVATMCLQPSRAAETAEEVAELIELSRAADAACFVGPESLSFGHTALTNERMLLGAYSLECSGPYTFFIGFEKVATAKRKVVDDRYVHYQEKVGEDGAIIESIIPDFSIKVSYEFVDESSDEIHRSGESTHALSPTTIAQSFFAAGFFSNLRSISKGRLFIKVSALSEFFEIYTKVRVSVWYGLRD